MKPPAYPASPACRRRVTSSGVNGQIVPLNSTNAAQTTAGMCNQASRGHRNTKSAPKTANNTNARCVTRIASAAARYAMSMGKAQLRGDVDAYRHSPAPPLMIETLEAARYRRAAKLARAFRSDSVRKDLVPVAHDQGLGTAGTESRAAIEVVHIAGVDVAQTFGQRNVARAGQRRRGGADDVGHLVVGMESGEVERHVRSELACNPLALGLDLRVGIVLAGNQQRGDLGPDIGLVVEIDERVEHRLQVRAAYLDIELVGEALQVHVGRVHLGVEVATRLDSYVARRHRDRLNAEIVAGIGGIHRVLGENHRVVVGKRDALAAGAPCRLRDRHG